MIRARDFSVEFLHDDTRGLVVRVKHLPTGEQRESTVPPGQGAVVLAIGCVVTEAEHQRLTAARHAEGWERIRWQASGCST
ncbi:MAG: hypothetical protein KF878_30245 [Planctomycetes bacterium]|nr:hypothetical protein [Planctomycetota bacterium]